MRSVSADVSLSYLDCRSVACFCQRSVSVSFSASSFDLNSSSSLALLQCFVESVRAFLSADLRSLISFRASSIDAGALVVSGVSPVAEVSVTDVSDVCVALSSDEGSFGISIIRPLSCCQDDVSRASQGKKRHLYLPWL